MVSSVVVKTCSVYYNTDECHNATTDDGNVTVTEGGTAIVVVSNMSLPSAVLYATTLYVVYGVDVAYSTIAYNISKYVHVGTYCISLFL